MNTSYAEHTGEGYQVSGTRVSLDSLVYAFLDGQTAESIAQSFPVLTLEQVYGAIAYYLAHRPGIDEYLRGERAAWDALRDQWRDQDPMFYQRLADAKRETAAPRA